LELGDRYFILVDGQDKPLVNVEYVLTGADGQQYPGKTDETGRSIMSDDTIGRPVSIEIQGQHFPGNQRT